MTFIVKGVKIRFTFLFFWIFTLFFLLDQSGMMFMGALAAVIHEFGHCIAFLLTGDIPEEISFEWTGIRMVRKNHPLSMGKELFQLFAGSMTNFFVFFLLVFSLDQISKTSLFAVSHLILGIFNLLPVKTLDGGKIVCLLLEHRFGIRRGYMTASILSYLVLLPVCLFGGYLFFSGRGSFSLLLIGIWMVFLCVREK